MGRAYGAVGYRDDDLADTGSPTSQINAEAHSIALSNTPAVIAIATIVKTIARKICGSATSRIPSPAIDKALSAQSC